MNIGNLTQGIGCLGQKYGRYPEESACRLTKKAIRRSEECACWLDRLLPTREDESRLEAVPLVKNLGRNFLHLPNDYDERMQTNVTVILSTDSMEKSGQTFTFDHIIMKRYPSVSFFTKVERNFVDCFKKLR